MNPVLLISLLSFFTFGPIIIGLVLWISGIRKKNKKRRHDGFVMMMISVVIILLIVFSIGATLFYLYLINS